MKETLIYLLFFGFVFSVAQAQNSDLPKGLTPVEREAMAEYLETRATEAPGLRVPPSDPVRTMAEWEEIEYLAITWTQYIPVLRDIVKFAHTQCKILIICSDSSAVIDYLSLRNVPLDNVSFLQTGFNSIWMRDYGANSVYTNDVDSLILVDWIYNRPRPQDDVVPAGIANLLNLPLYSMTSAPEDLVHTGGNFMSDGQGTAFSSELVLQENAPGGQFNPTNKSEAEIDSLMKRFMGIDEYVKMTNLPYDVIHHIDMHMKLLDEETLLIGEYPQGEADGPQIEANLQYVLSQFQSTFGHPFEVVRVPMPPHNGNYPDTPGAHYRTYANAVFVNKMILVPTYEQQYDSTALRIIGEQLPGYEVVGINCNQIIPASGALHCITRAIGVRDPLLITHRRLRDTDDNLNDYLVSAEIQHRSGIQSAQVYYTTDTASGFQLASMTLVDSATNRWEGYIPSQYNDTTVFYYLDAIAQSGKQIQRPITAPDGFYEFHVSGPPTAQDDPLADWLDFPAAFPNPAKAITCVPVKATQRMQASVRLYDPAGREVKELFEGVLQVGESKFFFYAGDYATGTYTLVLDTEYGRLSQKILILE
ncbi:MAG: agmatine deiminase family protein [Bacteroidota bacterium]